MNPGTRIGSYEVLSLLGAGGMGQVYRAKDSTLKREVALKVLPADVAKDRERLARFQREAEVLASLNHPHIAQIYGVEHAGDTFALVMELVEGEDLAQRIARGAIPLDEALPIARQIAEALEAAHDAGIIHRDLKPANIKVRPDGTVKVLDFGLAKAIEPAGSSSVDAMNSPTLSIHATQAGVILGTAAYMSPEQARGKKIDRRTDIWAFGCVLFEMLTGRRAFPGEDATDTIVAVVTKEPDWNALPNATPPALKLLLKRCLEKRATARLDSAIAFRMAVDDVQLEPSIDSTPASPPVHRKHFAALMWLALALIPLAALGGFVLKGYSNPQTSAPPQFVFTVEPKAGKFFGGIPSQPDYAISPNGRYLALSVDDATTTALELKRLDSLDSQLLAGTETGGFPFWSPDSTQLGFFTNTEVKRLQVSNGSVQRISTVAEGFSGGIGAGASWGRNNVILFASTVGLMKVSAEGGTPVPVLKGNQETTYGHPAWLPDERHFLLSVTRNGTSSVHVASIDGDELQLLIPDAARAMYLGSGHIAFVLQGTLFVQEFDVNRLQLGPTRFAVATGVAYQPGRAAFTASDNGVVAYRRSQSPSQLIWTGRSGVERSTIGDVGDRLNPRLSPDNQLLAYEQHDGDGGGDLWVLNLSRGAATRLTFDRAHARRPVWSPDGKRIAFAVPRVGLSIQNLDSTAQPVFAKDTGSQRQPSDWSADGRYIIGEQTSKDTRTDLWIMRIPDGVPEQLLSTKYAETEARISPDGKWFAYTSDESGSYEVYIRRFPEAAGKMQVSVGGGRTPRWSRDGQELRLYYLNRAGELTSVAVRGGSPTTVGEASKLFTTTLRGANGQNDYEIDSTGQRFLLNLLNANPSIVVLTDWRAAQGVPAQ